ncbi:MAG: protease complex subunit PrcB family protein [Elusimicrobia bacterium]|nr:protease complex subunit PrcB family protein [Elusimicrobiota bacterium]
MVLNRFCRLLFLLCFIVLWGCTHIPRHHTHTRTVRTKKHTIPHKPIINQKIKKNPISETEQPMERRAKAPPLFKEWIGTQSGIQEQKEIVIRDHKSWETLWNTHVSYKSPSPSPPKVNFKRMMAAAVFLGQKPSSGYTVKITAIKRLPEKIIVHYRENSPPRDAMLLQVITQPFHIKLIEYSDKPVEFIKKP